MKFYTPFKISENIRETPEGYLLCLGVPIARTGVQEYGEGECPLEPGPDGIVRVHRDAKEVFRPITIASFSGKSVTIKHPNDFVVPENWKDLTKGTIQNPRKGEELDEEGEEQLVADLLITDSMAIQLVKNGLREVSCGYEAEYEQTGEGEGRQYNIIGNHVALVEDGRAGPSYAIKDHNGKADMDSKKLIEKLKAKFGAKVVDEAMAEEKKEDKKESKDAGAYDEMMKKVTDLMQKVETLLENKKAKDDAEGEEKEEKSEDDDEGEKSENETEAAILERVKALEAAVSKLLEKEESEHSEDDAEGEEGEESQSKDDDESEEAEDDDEEESELTGDAARLEILAPGIKPISKEKPEDTKKRALVTAFGTKDGREVISSLTGSKKLVLDSAEKVQMLFMSASEVLKARRGTGLEGTKDGKGFKSEDGASASSPITPEKMNEINAQHWANRK